MPTIPTVFRSINSGDFRQTSFKAYKQYNVEVTGSGYIFLSGQHQKFAPPIGAAVAEDDPVTPNGTNQYMVWNHIDHRYYRHPYDPARSMEHTNRRKTDKFLFLTASLFSIPYFEMGEKLKPGSVLVQDVDWSVYDDGNGNLKDSAIVSASFADKRKLAAYWTFNNEFRKNNNNYGNISESIEYISYTHTPEYKSLATDIDIDQGITTTGTLAVRSGLQGGFNGQTSYIRTPHLDELNPGAGDNFAWSFWVQAPISQSDTSTTYNSLIRKDTVLVEDFYDPIDKLVKTRTTEKNISKFPYHVYRNNDSTGTIENGKIKFAIYGEDASVALISTTQCTGSHHIVAQRSGSEQQLWIDGVLEASSSSKTGPTKNLRDLIFGGKHLTNPFAKYSGSMSEIRYFKYGLSSNQISSLANVDYDSCSMYQTSTAGNVFYRNGHIVISSPIPKYEGALTGSYDIGYKGVHTIYENEAFVQVPKDACNVSMNPSATYNPPDGNESSNDYIASNGPGELIHPGFISGTMKPYITTIGLYNDKSQLLAVGKLSQAVQKRDDIDMNFVVRWDY
tara:strand:+ start:195 stop:1880 length:1686 start_codon:yes stop_codon:yes gene_type:complete